MTMQNNDVREKEFDDLFEREWIVIYNNLLIPAYQTLVPLEIKLAMRLTFKHVYTLQQEKIVDLEEEVDFFKDKYFEVCENLKCAEDQNHYLVLLKQYRDEKHIAEDENKSLKKELAQQKFNNAHNLSIDQQIQNKIESLKSDLKQMSYCVKVFLPELRGRDAIEIIKRHNLDKNEEV